MKHWRYRCVVAAALLSALLCACSILPELLPSASEPAALPTPAPSVAQSRWELAVQQGIPDEADTYFIRRMPQQQRELCAGIYQGIMAFEEEIEFPEPVDKQMISDTMWLLMYDCPELFQVGGDYSYYIREDEPDQVLSIKPTYIMDREKYNDALLQVREVLDTWLREVDGLDAYETQRLLYERLIQGCSYLEDGKYSGTVYGALVLGKARCEGYSKALCMALRGAGIPSLILTGEAWSEEDGPAKTQKHAWNIARVGEGYYQMDATWDDSEELLPQQTCYAYFNLTDGEMYQSRILDTLYESLDIPVCNDTQENYYVRNDLLLPQDADLKKSVYAALNDAYEHKETSVLLRVQTDEQLGEIKENMQEWMSGWYRRKKLAGSYKWAPFASSRVICILDLVYER